MRRENVMFRQLSRVSIALSLAFNLAIPAYPQAEASRKHPASSSKTAPKALTKEDAGKGTAPALTDRQRALHALNRLTFGPRPGDLDAVMAKGLDSWIEDQLHPESIDDSALNTRLAPYATTRMNSKQLAQTFPSDGAIRQVIAGKRQIPDDPATKLIYAVNVARIEQQDAAKTATAAAPAGTASATMSANPAAVSPSAASDATAQNPPSPPTAEDAARALADSLLVLPKNQRIAALESTPPDQLVNFPNLVRGDQRDRLLADFSPQEREIFRALASPQGVVTNEIQQAKVVRAIYSERQLLEVMTDFWFNHFNVYQNKNQDAWYTTAYERDVIRPRAFGKFYDLLVATAQSPAMLMYLDNWLSIGPHSLAAGKNGQSGLNENYGREVMELHTLGVNGGYSQSDVTELARVLTGWTIAQPDDGGQFQFDPRRHEPGVKTVVGEKFYESGSDEGLARPRYARTPSLHGAVHFPLHRHPLCLGRSALSHSSIAWPATFQSSDGDIREVLRTMLKSPEFWSPKNYRAKLKTPLEYVVSAVQRQRSQRWLLPMRSCKISTPWACSLTGSRFPRDIR